MQFHLAVHLPRRIHTRSPRKRLKFVGADIGRCSQQHRQWSREHFPFSPLASLSIWIFHAVESTYMNYFKADYGGHWPEWSDWIIQFTESVLSSSRPFLCAISLFCLQWRPTRWQPLTLWVTPAICTHLQKYVLEQHWNTENRCLHDSAGAIVQKRMINPR